MVNNICRVGLLTREEIIPNLFKMTFTSVENRFVCVHKFFEVSCLVHTAQSAKRLATVWKGRGSISGSSTASRPELGPMQHPVQWVQARS
jgi:hypothetical protein